MGDPGISLKCATLLAAWRLLKPVTPGTDPESLINQAKAGPSPVLQEEAVDAIEELALATGMRSRRIILDNGWWKQAAAPMLARVADRRRVKRGEEPPQSPSLAAGTGWVALLPRGGGGYRMLAAYPDAVYVVISVMGGRPNGANAFAWDPARRDFLPLEFTVPASAQ